MNIEKELSRRDTVAYEAPSKIIMNDIFGRWFRQANNTNVFVIEAHLQKAEQPKPKRSQVTIAPFKGVVHGHRPIAQKVLTTVAHGRRDTIAVVSDAPYYRYDLFGFWPDEMRNPVFSAFWSAWKNRKPISKPQRCKVANKREYSYSGAKRALATATTIGNAYAPKRMYQCDHCGKYHLTSKP